MELECFANNVKRTPQNPLLLPTSSYDELTSEQENFYEKKLFILRRHLIAQIINCGILLSDCFKFLFRSAAYLDESFLLVGKKLDNR
jgi:hypothetical protein